MPPFVMAAPPGMVERKVLVCGGQRPVLQGGRDSEVDGRRAEGSEEKSVLIEDEQCQD